MLLFEIPILKRVLASMPELHLANGRVAAASARIMGQVVTDNSQG